MDITDRIIEKYKKDRNIKDTYVLNDDEMYFIDEIVQLKIGQTLPIDSVVVPKGTCCLKPKKIGKVNDMFESWDECKNCGKEVL